MTWQLFNMAKQGLDLARSVSPSSTKPSMDSLNLEGFTSAIRIAMFPYAPYAKIKLEGYAINFDLPYTIGGLNTKSFTRYLEGTGRSDFIVIKRIARIMLDLFPPIPKEDGKDLEPITKIYIEIIAGLQFIRKAFFSDIQSNKKVPDPTDFDFKYNPKKHVEITEVMAGEAIQKTINLFEYCCKHKFVPKKELSPLQVKVKEGYGTIFIEHFSRGLEILKISQGKTPVTAKWICEEEFKSLDSLVKGRVKFYEDLISNQITLVPEIPGSHVFPPTPLEEIKKSQEIEILSPKELKLSLHLNDSENKDIKQETKEITTSQDASNII